MTVKEEIRKGLTVRVIIILLIVALAGPWISQIILRYSIKPWTYCGWFVGMFWIVLFFQAIGLINPKWKLTNAEIAVLFPAFMVISGKHFTTRGIPTLDNVMAYLDKGLFVFPRAFLDPTLSAYWLKMTPSYMFPKDLGVAKNLYMGLGGTPWGQLAGSMAYWTIFLILFAVIQICLVFAVWGYPWIKVEKILFPYGVGSVYLVSITEEDPETKRYKLFNLKLPETRTYWTGFFIGVLMSGIPMILEITPIVTPPAVFYFGHYPVKIPPLAAALPGSIASGTYVFWLFLVWILLPLDILYTFMIMYVVIGLIYRPLAVSMGIIPYTPGMEYDSGWGTMWLEPFPYGLMAHTGSIFAIALWSLWMMKDRLKTLASIIISDLTRKSSERKDLVEDGLPLRWPVWIGTIATIIWIAWYTATGTPFIIAVIFTIVWFLLMVGGARVWGEVAHVEPVMPGSLANQWLIYPLGSALGYWPWNVPSEGNNYAWFSYHVNSYFTTGPQARCFAGGGYGPTSVYYKICSDNHVNMGDAFKTALLAILIAAPVAQIANVWFVSNAGGIEHIYTYSAHHTTLSNQYILSDTGINPMFRRPASVAAYGIAGFIITLALYIVRLRAPWLPLNPVGVLVSWVFLGYAWINGLVIIIKLVCIRVFGVKKFEQYATPLVGGALIGTGAMFLLPALNQFILAIPVFQSYYAP